jgi:beta-glucuronidase
MLPYSELYPINNCRRVSLSLDGMWRFQFDPQAEGEAARWQEGLPKAISMPVPTSFADLFTDRDSRDYTGDFWYETEFELPALWQDGEVLVRFGSLTHRAWVWLNGKLLTYHEGGFLPVPVRLNEALQPGKNKLVVKLNNEVNETSIPCGIVKLNENGRKIAKPYFDFFNYSGIQRSVYLMCVPREAVQDYSVDFALEGADARVSYRVVTNGESPVRVRLYDAEGRCVAESTGKEGCLLVKEARLWNVLAAYLYTIEIDILDGESLLDRYSDHIGIRTVKIEGSRILINGKPVYLKGYGKHEDFEVIGRAPNGAVLKRDFECMKWTGANCFRTSHYPYDESWYRMADEEGFLVIDEVPAVGMMRSTHNFVAAGAGGAYTYFFECPTVPQLKAHHIQCVEEMIVRDKNHPSVFAWSLLNEPETVSDCARDYFAEVFAAARSFDPQNRPMTGAFEKNSKPELCKVYPFCDFICLNRYYGWYISGGELDEAESKFRDELDRWAAKKLNVPFVFTEFGTDTLGSEHKLPAVMWSQEYQDEYLEMNFKVFDSYDFVQGELVWNFADFQTSEGIFRVNGNKKGVFTRNRQPKQAAHVLRRRWTQLP